MEKTIKMDFEEYDNLLQELKSLKSEHEKLKKEKLIYQEFNAFRHVIVYGDEAIKETVQYLIDRIEHLFKKYENLKNSIPEKIRKRYNIG